MKLIHFIFLFTSFTALSQKDYGKTILDSLCSKSYAGRGYVNNGIEKASNFLVRELKKNDISPFPNHPYQQFYSFDVNTFPTPITVVLENDTLIPGIDYLVDAMSGSANGTFELYELNTSNYRQQLQHLKNLNPSNIIVFNFSNLKNRDSISYFRTLSYKLANQFPTLWIESNKMMYSVGRQAFKYPLLILDASKYNHQKQIYISVQNQFKKSYTCSNVIGYIPPLKKSYLSPARYIVFTAHYDHLGKMGQAIFPGANDNASGTAMLLSLARYYKQQPLKKYGIVFIFFSGEEAGLEGSKYFVNHPYFKLNRIKFLLNIDIMGGAGKGITVVNATKHPKEYQKMVFINEQKKYLGYVKKRGPTQNSDHYFFTQKKVPAFFIYSEGYLKNYHDVNDTSENTPLTKFDEVMELIIDFANSF